MATITPVKLVSPKSSGWQHADEQIWLTKPDGDPGWASYFVGKGFRVYLVDLPGTGKSNNLTKEEIEVAEIRSIKGSQIEREFTAPEVFNHITDRRWSTVQKHNKWPGVSTEMFLLPAPPTNWPNRLRLAGRTMAISTGIAPL